jgi:hypothetical protein
MEVAARTEITREMTGLEVALVLDVTGSMCDPCSKRDAMKQGALDLMDIMFGDNATVDDLWIGIVPFSQGVNIGTGRTDWLSNADNYNDEIYCSGSTSSGTPVCPNDSLTISSARVSTRTNPLTRVNRYMYSSEPGWYFAPHGWGGCVEARETGGEDITDTPPSSVGFPVYFAPDSSSVNDWRSSTGGYQVTSTRNANRNCPQNAITPLTNVKADLDAAITAIDVRGYTQLPLGASWGWRLLSPDWRGEWGGTMDANSLPLDYDEELSQKVVIFMTDGNNDMPSDATYTAYGRLTDGRLGTTDEGDAEAEMDDRFADVCNAMKAPEVGITIYTISFGDGVEEASKDLLRECASLEDYFFDAPTEEELGLVFHAIGDALSKLRVSK